MIDLIKNTLMHTNPQSDGDGKGLQKSTSLKFDMRGPTLFCKMKFGQTMLLMGFGLKSIRIIDTLL